MSGFSFLAGLTRPVACQHDVDRFRIQGDLRRAAHARARGCVVSSPRVSHPPSLGIVKHLPKLELTRILPTLMVMITRHHISSLRAGRLQAGH